ncbi:endonuclease/exonuclease/phosphatase [Danxiaibacter flavus]|uniref:Endonuclease/exonuclease/phosphatase n=1 Tax=Danxiaibacter flavus TaxID=3049108 RepID=A0ABV3Z802_9BACT|nr:endonuclease/exonuclease/phosphatase [Chitinophagaceae bacterium DXS]
MKPSILWVLTLLPLISLCQPNYKRAVVGFYNLENFYDTVNNPAINDDEFLPDGPRRYNTSVYRDKVEKLATVVARLGKTFSIDGPAFLGVAEVENDTVLNDLVRHPFIRERDYRFVHYDSKDQRGVDVALLYNPGYFDMQQSFKLNVQLPGGSKESAFTRDVLWVKGLLFGEEVHVFVNHWPSRLGGEARSEPARIAAANVNRQIIDSLLQSNADCKIIVMGDLNDDPVNNSVTKGLRANGHANALRAGELYNPWLEKYRKGIGTLAYQDAWSLFDQIILSQGWLNQQQDGIFFYKAHVFNESFLTENIGKYKGYPMRTWDGLSYRGGYSDHFPTYVVILKKAN